LAPLFYSEIEEQRGESDIEVRPQSALIEVNLFALSLLGVDRNERAAVLDAVEDTDESVSSKERLRHRLLAMASVGVLDEKAIAAISPNALSAMTTDGTLSNTAMVFASERAATTRQLLNDLTDMLNVSEAELKKCVPLTMLLGQQPVSLPPPPEPQPTILPTNLSQDRAITSAMSAPLTVVTGPPGTGKSQILVNTIAVAVDRGESVLFASKNNQAVDVVFQRLAAASTEAVPLRVGTVSFRGTTAETIRSALARSRTADPSIANARQKWSAIATSLATHYTVEESRVDLQEQVSEAEANYQSRSQGLAAPYLAIQDPELLRQCVERLTKTLAELAKRPWFPFFKKSRLRKKQEAVQAALGSLQSVVPPPVEKDIPDQDNAEGLRSFVNLLRTAYEALVQANETSVLRSRLNALPSRWDVQETIREADEKRTAAARELFDANWANAVRNSTSDARAKASSFAAALNKIAAGKSASTSAMRKSIPDVLRVFPIWGVTNLSTRTNFDLDAGMFDLLVIDEASQCDVASVLPLLFRAHRALLIGDANQLIHIAGITQHQDAIAATEAKVTGQELLSFGYRATSLFTLASRCFGEDPLFLEEHYRSQEAIITFSNDLLYGSRLVVLTDNEPLDDGPAVEWINVSGEYARGQGGSSVINAAEAAVVVDLAVRLHGNDKNFSIGVVAPYRAQVEKIRKALTARLDDAHGVIVDTAHRFQGDEKDVIIFSPTVSMSMPDRNIRFANDHNLVNVAVTRARKRLIVVGDREACMSGGGILGHLATYAQDLSDGRFESPIERRLYLALIENGISTQPGLTVNGYRLDLAYEDDGTKLDIECDGAATHLNLRNDAVRDTQLSAAGWEVLRFSGRQINGDVDSCVSKVVRHARDR
jgi:very-short-patch-repair endonuclease